jgi:PAS domain S-box-containing protein
MDLHPGPEKRRVPAGKLAELYPIRRALEENEDWFQDVVEHSRNLLCTHDLEGRLLSVNRAPARVLGYSVEELLRLPLRDIIAPKFQGDFDAYLDQVRRAGESSGLMAVTTKSGERRIWQYYSTLRTADVASPIVRVIAQDITEQRRTEKLLREASEDLLRRMRECERTIEGLMLFRTLLDHSNDAIEVVDPETLRFLDVNEKSCLELGYSREELLSMRVFDIDPGLTEASTTKITEELQKSGYLVMESVHRRKDGTVFLVEVSLRWVQLDRGYVVVIARDLTQRKQAEAQLQASENRYRAVHDSAPVGICRVETATGRFLEVNPKYCEIAGRTEKDLLGRTFQSITHPDDIGRNVEELRQLEAGEVRQFEMEKRYLRPDGSVRWVEVRVAAMCPEGEPPDWNMAIVQDITERKQTGERLREYERVVEGLEEMICVVDRDYRYVIANRAFLNYRSLEREQIVGHFAPEVIGKEIFETVVKPRVEECFQGKAVQYEMKYTYPKMGERDLLLNYFPIEGPSGIDRIVSILQDITERKRAEARLKEYARVVEGLEEMIVVVDRDYRYVIANRAYLAYRGSEKEQVLGRRVDEVVNREVFDQVVKSRVDEAFRGKVVQYEMKYTYPEIGERDLFISYFPIEGPTGVDRIASVMQDITESKRAEEAIKESEEKFSKAFRQSPMVLTLSSMRNHHYIDVNETFERLTGWRRDEVIGRTALDIGLWTPGDVDLAKLLLTEGSVRDVESRFRMRDGSFRIGLSTAELIEVNGEPCMLAVTADVTERKQAEEALRRSEERFRIALECSPVKIFNQDRDLRYTWAYNLPEGWSEQDCLGKTDEEIFDAENAAKMVALKRPVLESGRGIRQEFSLTARGKTYHCDMTVEPLLDATGQVVGVNSAWVDITHLREVTEELRLAKEKLSEEKLYLEESIDTELGFGEIIGRSRALKEVMQKVAKVAPSDATVLLLGETGTGKELVARALHRMSQREGKSFIKLNCAAIPSGLLESELFGHEKGAFTGAVARKLGRLELADKGTLFLDEIGEIPLSLQPKLLRVIQDMEFERLGGTQTLKVNFRLLAATNRDLLQSVQAREFRSDLYYRLNVFPILIPPLRERREDIRPLAEHFVRKFSQQMKKSITSIPSRTMEMLLRWEWPGNIRELENFVERSVILSPGSVLMAPLTELLMAVDEGNGGKNVPLRGKERARILQALRDCRGKLGGPEGAAARLGLKRTTLQSRLDQLGIKPGMYRA